MDLVSLIRKKRQTLFSIFLIFLLVGLIVVFSQSFKYGARSKILVIQEGTGRVDPFAVSRSVEYISNLLTRVIQSNSFFEEVMSSDFNIDRDYFGQSSIRRMKNWSKTVSAKNIDDSGIININVYHPDNYQARQIALAVNHVLITKHQGYHGLGTSVKISVIDQPVVSAYPVKPNLPLSLLSIMALSLFLGLIYIYLFPEEKYDINILRRKKRIKKEKPRTTLVEEKRENPTLIIEKDNLNNINKSASIDSLFEDDE